MSTTTKNNSNSVDTAAAISEAEDMKMFQAARRNGRRNALGDLSEHLTQGNPSNFTIPISHPFILANASKSTSDVDKMAPHFQSMSIKH